MKIPDGIIPISYDYKKAGKFLREIAMELTHREFLIPQHERAMVFAALVYFLRDEKAAEAIGLDLNKGLMLSGPIGCGKTTLFRIMQKFPKNQASFGIVSTRKVVSEFMQQGYEILENYSFGQQYNYNRKPIVWCFDDLGAEASSKYFGNNCNVMAEILLSRYDLFIEKGIPTHLTTNLTAAEIEQVYGNRIRSRMREMFNLIGYSAKSTDKRL
ncbi:hypothetical protein SAMN05443429_1012 [Cruoricaptor ignavus]|uniref:Uncharacterized protein n=1 Tax=Cruoricaptor ignavus TaxID=1118202 RepID=A0A1M5ZWZ1_9FLAO|nr:AAA family ATPase [Cruoricaptor ignavus]SHI28807.1 hypothetical protein SAMN05443429_1012 [Cruoricaptor ignavus]